MILMVWFGLVGITGFNHFDPVGRFCVVMSFWETDIESPPYMTNRIQFQQSLYSS